MTYWLFIIPFVAAGIGWIVNSIAVKLFFYPQQPLNFLGIRMQGLFPKRRQAWAQNLGKLVSAELASFGLAQKISDPAKLEKVMPLIETHIDDFLRNKLKAQMPVIAMFVGDKTIQSMKSVFMQEIQTLLPQVIGQFAGNLEKELDIEQLVVRKMTGVSSAQLEKLLAKELRYARMAGAITGFLAGLLQLAITAFITR